MDKNCEIYDTLCNNFGLIGRVFADYDDNFVKLDAAVRKNKKKIGTLSFNLAVLGIIFAVDFVYTGKLLKENKEKIDELEYKIDKIEGENARKIG